MDSLCRNPFRLFFPLGILAGLLGVGHWALWTVGIPVDHIKVLHITLQSQGFLAFFVVGFLLTTFPRFSGADIARPWEIALALVGGLTFLGAEMARHWTLSHVGFLLMVGVLPVFAVRRLSSRTKKVPPSFALVGFGLLHAVLGALLSLISGMGEKNLYFFSVGRQMVQVGFLLCIVLGITAKLAPFLMGYTDEPGRGEVGPSLKDVVVHGGVGTLLMGSFFLEPVAPRWAMGLRALLVTGHMLVFAKIARPLKKRTATMWLFWTSCWMLPIGLWLVFGLPAYRVALLHILFIGGFSLMIFSFGMLIVLSHSGQAALLNGKLWALKTVGLFALLALVCRVAADFLPEQYMRLLHSASGFWVLAAAVWLGYAVTKMRVVQAEH